MIEIIQAQCHETCLDIIGPGEHIANVNPVDDTYPQVWRVDCNSCGTCVRSGLTSKREAKDAAVSHVKLSSQEKHVL